MDKLKTLLLIILLGLNVYISYYLLFIEGRPKPQPIELETEVVRDTVKYSYANYLLTIQSADKYRNELSREWASSHLGKRMKILDAARLEIINLLYRDIFPFWYGTPWGVKGVTEVPGKGKISGAFFVATTLEHAGFNLDRVAMGQMNTEKFIRTLTDSKNIKRFRDLAFYAFLDSIHIWGEGLYLVGADKHIGYILNANNQLRLIHAASDKPPMVRQERADTSVVLEESKIRVLGKLSADRGLLEKWVTGQPILVK